MCVQSKTLAIFISVSVRSRDTRSQNDLQVTALRPAFPVSLLGEKFSKLKEVNFSCRSSEGVGCIQSRNGAIDSVSPVVCDTRWSFMFDLLREQRLWVCLLAFIPAITFVHDSLRMGRAFLQWILFDFVRELPLQSMVIVFASLSSIVTVQCSAAEKRLLDLLLANYSSAVRPSPTPKDVMHITLTLALYNIIEVQEKNEVIITNGELIQSWVDFHLKWRPEDFGGTEVVNIPYDLVWTPDTVVYNSASESYLDNIMNTRVSLKHTGEITFLSHGIFKTSCKMNVAFFPFDRQSCQMKFGSWTQDRSQIILERDRDIEKASKVYETNGEFELISLKAREDSFNDPCCNSPVATITYTIVIARRTAFYLFTFVMPSILINIITLLVFVVPADSGEKVTLGISAMLNMIVFFMNMREDLPPSEETPLISMYYAVCICLVAAATGMAVLVLNLHYKGNRGMRVPRFVRYVVLNLMARMVFMGGRKERKRSHKEEPPLHPFHVSVNKLFGEVRPNLLEVRPQAMNLWNEDKYERLNQRFTQHKLDHESTSEKHIVMLLEDIHRRLDDMDTRRLEKEGLDDIIEEWHQVSRVCDRFLLILFTTMSVVTSICILFSSPYFP